MLQCMLTGYSKHNKTYKLNIWILLKSLVLLVVTIYTLLDNNSSFLVHFFILDIFLVVYLFTCKSYVKLNISYLFVLIYLIISLLTYYSQIYCTGTPFVFPDSSEFLHATFDQIDKTPYEIGYTGYYFLLTTLGDFLSNPSYQSFMTLKLTSLFAGAFSVILTYDISYCFFRKTYAIYIALIVGFIPYFVFYSSVLLRDIFIVVFTLYIIFHLINFNKNILVSSIKISFALVFVFFFRIENGLFLFVVVLAYLTFFNLLNQSISFQNGLFTLLILAVLIGSYLIYIDRNILEFFISTWARYTTRAEMLADKDSLGITIKNVTFPFNMLLTFLFSQIAPFPFWVHAVEKTPIYIIEGIGGAVWLIVWPFALLSVSIKNIRKRIDSRLLFLFLVAIIYCLLVAFIQPKQRTLMAFYPIILITASYSFLYLSKVNIFIIVYTTYSCYILLYPVYYILKL